jgi:glucosamine-6-phosphate deaminase
MEKLIFETAQQMGKEAAVRAAALLNQAIMQNGKARMLLSTGQSQFEFFNNIILQDIDWEKVEIFHLDEYVGISGEHPASFVKYIKERLVKHISPKQVYFVDGAGNIEANIKYLTEQIKKEPIDVAMIGIGENGHVAFNDPPADFDTKESYKVVTLDEKCRLQQVGEGWFDNIGQVPKKAVTMTVYQIMQSRHILSCVPHSVKAQAVKAVLESEVNNQIPATILKTHPSWVLLLDKDSASLLE